MTSTTPLLIGGLGGPELLIILAVLLLLFGASKLPELARGGGQALRIFKAETKGLTDTDDAKPAPVATTPVATTPVTTTPVATTPVEPTPVATPVEPTVAPVSEPVIVETPREHDAPRS